MENFPASSLALFLSLSQSVEVAAPLTRSTSDERRRDRRAVLRQPYRKRPNRQHHTLHPQNGLHRLQQPVGQHHRVTRAPSAKKTKPLVSQPRGFSAC